MTDNPLLDYIRYEAQVFEELQKLPKCVLCGEPIQQEKAVFINNDWYCDYCLTDTRKYTADYKKL